MRTPSHNSFVPMYIYISITVDGSEIPRSPVDMVVYPIIYYSFLYIPGGAGFPSSTVPSCCNLPKVSLRISCCLTRSHAHKGLKARMMYQL